MIFAETLEQRQIAKAMMNHELLKHVEMIENDSILPYLQQSTNHPYCMGETFKDYGHGTVLLGPKPGDDPTKYWAINTWGTQDWEIRKKYGRQFSAGSKKSYWWRVKQDDPPGHFTVDFTEKGLSGGKKISEEKDFTWQMVDRRIYSLGSVHSPPLPDAKFKDLIVRTLWQSKKKFIFLFFFLVHSFLFEFSAFRFPDDLRQVVDTYPLIFLKGVDETTNGGDSPLFLAIGANRINLVEKLVRDHGSDLNQDVLGFKPLHKAVFHSNKEIVTYLIQAGALINAQSEEGALTAYEVAKMQNDQPMVDLLISYGANQEQKALNGVALRHALETLRGDVKLQSAFEKLREYGEKRRRSNSNNEAFKAVAMKVARAEPPKRTKRSLTF